MRKTFSIKNLATLLFTSSVVLFSASAHASLSSKPATPSQMRIVAKKATAKDIAFQYKLAKKASRVENGHLSTSSRHSARQKVNSVYRKWVGTRYRLGGNGVGGIDCSAFVQKVMGGGFNKYLPRSTAEQRYSGKSIAKSDLRPGDLVFFRSNSHVGVYIGGGKFVHASSSRGVTTSSLSENYWVRTYSQSRRVL